MALKRLSQLRIGARNCGGLSDVTVTICKDLEFDILALSPIHKWPSDTDAIFSERGTEYGAIWDTSYTYESTALVRQVLLNCVKPTHETPIADVPNLSIENATKFF